jgi:hypothetical protein
MSNPPREARPTDRNETGRRKRIPLGQAQQRLGANIRPGYVGRWINDTPGRLKQAEAAGYTFVGDGTGAKSTELGERVAQEVGGGTKAYLMEIPQEWHAEDQAAKQERVNAAEQQIRLGAAERQTGDGRYVPQGSIEIKRDR